MGVRVGRRVLRGRPRRAPHARCRRGDAHRARRAARVAISNAGAARRRGAGLGADAVHPGYGFLAENAAFAAAVEAAGLVFIGPDARADPCDGRQARGARASRDRAGVPIVPGRRGRRCARRCARAKQPSGYPVHRQGGARRRRQGHARGAANEHELAEALESAQRVAAVGVRRRAVYLEQLIERARHVEVQVLGDGAGQRGPPVRARVLAPAPAPEGDRGAPVARVSTTELRAQITRRRRALAQAVRLPRRRHASSSCSTRDGRLLLPRDEHAAPGGAPGHRAGHRRRPGARAARDRGDRQAAVRAAPTVPRHGHAIEARVYAEDAAREFLPQVGHGVARALAATAVRARGPRRRDRRRGAASTTTRCLAKIIAYGPRRATALAAACRRARRHARARRGHEPPVPARAAARARDAQAALTTRNGSSASSSAGSRSSMRAPAPDWHSPRQRSPTR